MNLNRVRKHMQGQGGFTLIELVIVITIVGILAAVALPRFIALQQDARIAKLKAFRGSVAAASALVHSVYLARAGIADSAACSDGNTADNLAGSGVGPPVYGTVCTEGGLVNIYNGYPASPPLGTAGIISAAGLSSIFTPSLLDLNREGIGASVNVANTITTISVIGGTGTTGASGSQVNATCSFTYTMPTTAGAAPTISATTTTGC